MDFNHKDTKSKKAHMNLRVLSGGLTVAAILLFSGCGSVKKISRQPLWQEAAKRTDDPLPIPNQYGPFATCEKISPVFWLGNNDDPEPPGWYRPDDPKRLRKWYVRNPFHNFTFYILGIADLEFTRIGNHPTEVFNPHGGWNWAWSHAKLLPFPFVSYRRDRTQAYFGWRERGNFGIAFRRLKPEPAGDSSEENEAGAGDDRK